jgi:hypothetical protein
MDMVTVTVRIPEQFYDMDVPEADWNNAEDKALLADLYIPTDFEVKEELYGPDGQQVPGW